MMIASGASRADGALPPPLAGEGWGEGVSAIENPQEERALTRAFGATSPASEGFAQRRICDSLGPVFGGGLGWHIGRLDNRASRMRWCRGGGKEARC